MIHGIINVYKEKGFTSHDVVAKLRGIVGQKKIGHTGTLDPDATGVLPVCLGKATKLCDLLTDKDKNGSSAGPYGGVVFQRNLYQDSLPRYRRTAWMWRMYGIADPYKSIGVSDKGCKDTGRNRSIKAGRNA